VDGSTGSGLLATVQFEGVSVDDSALEIKEVTLLDPDGTELEYTVSDGTVKVIPEFGLISMIIALMAITLAAVALKKRTL
jgi:hypothetical protein